MAKNFGRFENWIAEGVTNKVNYSRQVTYVVRKSLQKQEAIPLPKQQHALPDVS